MKAELARRKAFAKYAREIISAWPDYAKPLPAATNETDRRMQEQLKASLEILRTVWRWRRAGYCSEELFQAALTGWWVDRLHAVEIFGIVRIK